MGAQDKLVPKANTIVNNYNNTVWSTKSTFRLPSKKNSKYKNPLIDALDFLSSIYAKSLKIADNNIIWNGDLVSTATLTNKQLSNHAPDRGVHDDILPGFAATTIEEWNELQTGISRAYNIIQTVNIPYLAPPNYTGFELISSLNRMGITNLPNVLNDATGNPIILPAPQLVPGIEYAKSWNEVKVPLDASLGYETPYISPVFPSLVNLAPVPPTLPNAWYRYTGKSKWSYPFTGWNLVK